MTAASAKTIASFITVVMTFLGWSPSDYAKYLPQEIRSQIILELPIAETAATSSEPTKLKPVVPKVEATAPPTQKIITPPAPPPPPPPPPPPAGEAAPLPLARGRDGEGFVSENLPTEEKIKLSTV